MASKMQQAAAIAEYCLEPASTDLKNRSLKLLAALQVRTPQTTRYTPGNNYDSCN
jgi:hypothetical protein